jgi:hypothetical protein
MQLCRGVDLYTKRAEYHQKYGIFSTWPSSGCSVDPEQVTSYESPRTR